MPSRLSARDFSMVIALLLICGFFSVDWAALLHGGGLHVSSFLSARNLSHLVTELSITGTLAMGMFIIILPGHIDLSAGSGVGLLGGIASVLIIQHDVPAPAALAVALAAGVLLWFLMGTLIVRERIPAFIITLGGMLIYKGLFWQVIGSSTIPVTHGGEDNLYSLLTTYYLPPLAGLILAALLSLGVILASLHNRRQMRSHGFAEEDRETHFLKLFVTVQAMFLFVIVTNQFRGIPLPAMILGTLAMGVYALTKHTPFGRYLYAVGGSEEAAVVSGLPVQKVVIAAFAIMGGIVAVTGFMQTSYTGSSTTTIGELMELDAVAACVIGGVSLRGGRGSVMGALFGALIMACLLNGMWLMAIPEWKKLVARGAVLILAVWMDKRLEK
ncbi:MAG: ATPase [Verrucomicrobiaceae bacterium]|nr:ATPase [Verrucomicrobiaceae bacterium]